MFFFKLPKKPCPTSILYLPQALGSNWTWWGKVLEIKYWSPFLISRKDHQKQSQRCGYHRITSPTVISHYQNIQTHTVCVLLIWLNPPTTLPWLASYMGSKSNLLSANAPSPLFSLISLKPGFLFSMKSPWMEGFSLPSLLPKSGKVRISVAAPNGHFSSFCSNMLLMVFPPHDDLLGTESPALMIPFLTLNALNDG